MMISTAFEDDMTIRGRIIAFLLLIRYANLWTWPFNLVQRSYMAGHVVDPSTKFKYTTPICCWASSYYVQNSWPLLINKVLNVSHSREAKHPKCGRTTFTINSYRRALKPGHCVSKKISPARDWRSTPTYCQLQSHMTQKNRTKIKNPAPISFR